VGPKRIITIDGPAGAGKSTVGQRLAQSLGYLYLDSGALYRAVALVARQRGLDLDDPGALPGFLAGFHPEVRAEGGFHLLLDGRDLTEEIRSAGVSREASKVAVLPAVRRWVKERLRYLARNGGVVAEGRDQGSVVFPEADFKFYLDATLATRAARRRRDFKGEEDPPPLEAIMADLAARDRRDATRPEAPLTVPQDAAVIDTTELSIEEVVAQCLARISGQPDDKPSKLV
jgi:cytidylate kinase